MKVILEYTLLLVANIGNLFVLLWFLLGMDTYGNAFLIPSSVHSNPFGQVLLRILILQLETISWLAITYFVNLGVLNYVRNDGPVKNLAIIAGIGGYVCVTLVTAFYFYNVVLSNA